MTSFNGNSYSKPQTAPERRAASRRHAAEQRARVAVLSQNSKTRLLARAMVSAAADRGEILEKDGVRIGLTPREVQTLFPAALEVARGMEPRLSDMVTQ